MEKIFTFCCILCLFVGSGLLNAQTEEWGIASQVFYNRFYDRSVNLDFQVTDPTAIGMGGAYLAIADNPQAILLNPAGLTQSQSPQANTIVQFDFNSREYETARHSGIKVLSTPKPIFTFPAASGIFPFNIGSRRLAIGISYFTVINQRAKIEETQFFYGGGRIDEHKDIFGGVKTIAGAFAVELFPQVSLGLAYQYLFGNNSYDLKIQSPFADQRVYFRFEDEEKATGHLINFGVLLKPFKWFSLGVTLTPKWTYTVEESLEKIQIANFDLDTGWETIYFETAKDSMAKLETKIPLVYRLGAVFQPLSRLKIAASVEMINWSKSELTRNSIALENSLEDVLHQHYGIEYRFGTPELQVPMRFGYYTNDLPQKDQFFDGNYYGEQIEQYFWTFGFGVVLKHLQFDFAFRQGTTEIGWWMRSADFYNNRLFYTKDHFNQGMLGITYNL